MTRTWGVEVGKVELCATFTSFCHIPLFIANLPYNKTWRSCKYRIWKIIGVLTSSCNEYLWVGRRISFRMAPWKFSLTCHTHYHILLNLPDARCISLSAKVSHMVFCWYCYFIVINNRLCAKLSVQAKSDATRYLISFVRLICHTMYYQW